MFGAMLGVSAGSFPVDKSGFGSGGLDFAGPSAEVGASWRSKSAFTFLPRDASHTAVLRISKNLDVAILV